MVNNYNNYRQLHQMALPFLPAILRRLLPSGKVMGREYIALNPRRYDQKLGSFKINLINGRWADFAANTAGGDITSLIAYVLAIGQYEAAKLLMKMIGRTPS